MRVNRGLPIYKVTGRLPQPDGRRMTVFCNASSEADAAIVGVCEGLHTVDHVKLCTHEMITRWEGEFRTSGPRTI